MEQVLLPKEVVEMINNIREVHGERMLFNYPALASKYKTVYNYINSSDENFKKYFTGLINGYQIEWTKEEKLKRYYQGFKDNGHTGKYLLIKKVLEILEIEIEGVNK
jgi:hypothetical protein